MLQELKQKVCNANIELQTHNLVIYSWGNVSGIDRESGIVAIKPSGIAYDDLTPEKIVLIDLDGNIRQGALSPSSDTPTHLELYRQFENIGGLCHTHSVFATIWAQACNEIPCFGTTHADFVHGPIPVTAPMTNQQIETDYELNTGKVIIERLKDLDPARTPAVLVANHGPFTWGQSPKKAVEHAAVLEQIAKMALGTIALNPQQKQIAKALLDKHYLRKHGKDSYYGQKNQEE